MPEPALYHFTSGHHLARVLAKGITKGVLPWKIDAEDRVGFVPGWQWLTADPDWQQDWAQPALGALAKYRKDEHRVTVVIPAPFRDRLVPWPELERRYRPQSAAFLNSFSGARHWSVFHGPIPPAWFLAVDKNPTRREMYLSPEA